MILLQWPASIKQGPEVPATRVSRPWPRGLHFPPRQLEWNPEQPLWGSACLDSKDELWLPPFGHPWKARPPHWQQQRPPPKGSGLISDPQSRVRPVVQSLGTCVCPQQSGALDHAEAETPALWDQMKQTAHLSGLGPKALSPAPGGNETWAVVGDEKATAGDSGGQAAGRAWANAQRQEN